MKTFIKIIGVIIALIIVLAIVGFFLPSKLKVQRSATIKATPESIYNQIANLKNWPAWSPWQRMDPNMTITYFGAESGTGQGYTWKSANGKVGEGKMTIVDAKPNENVRIKMQFGSMATNFADFNIKTTDEGTEVTWTMEGDLGRNPLKHYLGLMMDKMVGPDFEHGLHNLDSVAVHSPHAVTPPKDVKNSY